MGRAMLDRAIITSIFELNKIINTPLKEKLSSLEEMGRNKFNVLNFSIGLIDKYGYETYITNYSAEIERLSTDLGEDFIICEDLFNDNRFKGLELTYDTVKINFFAKYPFFDKSNCQVGSILLFDVIPKFFNIKEFILDLKKMITLLQNQLTDIRISPAQIQMLENLLSDEEYSLLDPSTNLWNTEGFKKILEYQLDMNEFFGLAFIEIGSMDQLKILYGEMIVNKLITAVAKKILSNVRTEDTIGYHTDGVFQLLIHTTDTQKVSLVIERMRGLLTQINIEDTIYQLEPAIGYGFVRPGISIMPDSLLLQATAWLKCAKNNQDRVYSSDVI